MTDVQRLVSGIRLYMSRFVISGSYLSSGAVLHPSSSENRCFSPSVFGDRYAVCTYCGNANLLMHHHRVAHYTLVHNIQLSYSGRMAEFALLSPPTRIVERMRIIAQGCDRFSLFFQNGKDAITEQTVFLEVPGQEPSEKILFECLPLSRERALKNNRTPACSRYARYVPSSTYLCSMRVLILYTHD